ncbi:hypothetical protein [Sphingobium cloacae]|uniref:hypothetical protein n=1 Tax=Sphingobium cloacae TaxID=120107 RepID=UPI001470EB00|nr:hypothetical protein [Sphingobium cloacae]
MEKALRALLTDPVTGDPLDPMDCISLAMGLCVAVLVILAMLVMSLGMGAGQ